MNDRSSGLPAKRRDIRFVPAQGNILRNEQLFRFHPLFNAGKVVAAFGGFVGKPRQDLLARLAWIDNRKHVAMLGEHGANRSCNQMLAHRHGGPPFALWV